MLDDFNPRYLAGRHDDVVMEFPRTAVDEYASSDDVIFFLDVREVSSELLNRFHGRRSLFALDDDGPVFPVKQDHV